MENSNNRDKKGEIIVFGEAVVENAIKKWLRGNRERNLKLIESAKEQLDMYGGVYPIANYFSGVAKIQLRDDDLEEALKQVFGAMQLLLNDTKFGDLKVLKSCREMLYFLAKEDDYFAFESSPAKTSLEELKEIIADINKTGPSKELLSKAFAHMDAFLSQQA